VKVANEWRVSWKMHDGSWASMSWWRRDPLAEQEARRFQKALLDAGYEVQLIARTDEVVE